STWVCGRNTSGQLGLNPQAFPSASEPSRLPLEATFPWATPPTPGAGAGAGAGVVLAAAGRAHTLLLLANGKVLGFGSNEFGNLGYTPTEE
ncbi:unnamed protein product, partial [Discosporangium mesarthrocarpum]